jgi:RNA recognition motif-containing protein
MRIRWGTPSSEEILDQPSAGLGERLSRLTFRGNGNESSTPGPSNPKQPSRKEEGTKRKRSGISFAKIKDIELAKKKAARRRQLKKREWSFVFVGNIKPTVNESVLHQFFASCGTIIRIQIRCSRGGAVTIGVIPDNIHADRDFQYATIEFMNTNAVKKALKLNGARLHGTPLVVSVSAADLPEVKDIVHKHLGGVREQNGLPNPWNVKPTGFKPATIYQTELLLDVASTHVKPDRNRIMGFSFGKCVM